MSIKLILAVAVLIVAGLVAVCRVMSIVSVPSISVSSATFKVTVAEVFPAAIVILPD